MTHPAHVPAELVYAFDIRRDQQLMVDPHKRIAEVASRFPGGIFYSPCNGGHWVITSYQVLCDAACTPEIFSSKQVGIPSNKNSPPLIPINIDPPDHAKYRMGIMWAFTPQKVRQMEKSIRQLTNTLIDKVIEQGECDFVNAISEPLPVTVFMQLMGLPLERSDEFRELAVIVLSSADEDERAVTVQKVMVLMTETIKQRQKNRANDLVSGLIDAKIDGRPMTMSELQTYCMLLFFAGLDTVVNGISYGIRHLAQNPELQQQIKQQPKIAAEVVEEVLRCYSFVNTGRIVSKNYEFYGLQMKKGDRVLLCKTAANLDPNVFKNPQKFDLNRVNRRHVAFNTGPHHCIGAHLARMELTVIYQEWCQRVENFYLDKSKPPRFVGGTVLGVEHLHIKW